MGGWVSGWEGRGGVSLKTEETDYISKPGPVLGPDYRGRP